MYYLIDGTRVTREQIQSAYEAGTARLVHGHGDHCTTTGLQLDGRDIDTRGQCRRMAEETWTRVPEHLGAALLAAS